MKKKELMEKLKSSFHYDEHKFKSIKDMLLGVPDGADLGNMPSADGLKPISRNPDNDLQSTEDADIKANEEALPCIEEAVEKWVRDNVPSALSASKEFFDYSKSKNVAMWVVIAFFAASAITAIVCTCLSFRNAWWKERLWITGAVIGMADMAFGVVSFIWERVSDLKAEKRAKKSNKIIIEDAVEGTVVVDDLILTLTNGKYWVRGYNGTESCVKIPAEYKGTKVVGIEERAFYQNKQIKSVEMPDGVTTIAAQAFSLSSLERIMLPKTLSAFSETAFDYCYELCEINMPKDGGTYYSVKNNCLIHRSTKTLVRGCNGSEIPSDGSVTAIGPKAFAHCRIASVTIPTAVKRIGGSAFYGCEDLSSVSLPDGLHAIEPRVFWQSGIRKITICEGVESIGEYAFFLCEKLVEVSLPASLQTIENNAFEKCVNLKRIVYAGTAEQWASVVKGATWDKEAGKYQVICTK